jgi:hypothetical protein
MLERGRPSVVKGFWPPGFLNTYFFVWSAGRLPQSSIAWMAARYVNRKYSNGPQEAKAQVSSQTTDSHVDPGDRWSRLRTVCRSRLWSSCADCPYHTAASCAEVASYTLLARGLRERGHERDCLPSQALGLARTGGTPGWAACARSGAHGILQLRRRCWRSQRISSTLTTVNPRR